MSKLSDVMTNRGWAAVQLLAGCMAAGKGATEGTYAYCNDKASKQLRESGVNPDAPFFPQGMTSEHGVV